MDAGGNVKRLALLLATALAASLVHTVPMSAQAATTSPAYCAVVTQTMKYIRYDPDLEPRNVELYDLVADPYELQNRAYDPGYADQKAALLARLRELCSPTPIDYQFTN
jgi:hypothetical protein